MKFHLPNYKYLMKAMLIIVVLIVIPMTIGTNVAAGFNEEQSFNVIYFYTSVCQQCQDVEDFIHILDDISKKTGTGWKSVVKAYNITEPYGMKLLDKYIHEYNVPEQQQSSPIVFAGGTFFQTEINIKRGLEELLLQGTIPETPIFVLEASDEEGITERFSAINAIEVFAVGLVNGLNPCSLSMFLFFLSMIIAKKEKIGKMAFAFGTGKFVMYLLLGTILFEVFSKINAKTYGVVIKIFIIVFSLIIAVVNVQDLFAARNERYALIRNQLPKGLRRINHEWIQRIIKNGSGYTLVWFSFLLGVIISIGEFLCTGQMYLATILYVLHGNQTLNTRAFLYLLIYDATFLIPLIILTIAIIKGRELFEMSETIRIKLPLIKLISSLIFIIFAMFVIIFW